MKSTLFISDLHLDPSQSQMVLLFQQLLNEIPKHVQKIYVLGDLFEAWAGDDDLSDFNKKIIASFQQLSQHGVKVYFMHGNRDFMIGNKFAKMTGITLLPDPTLIKIYDQQILLTHGDLLCTDDKRYQRYRSIIQHPMTRWLLRCSSLAWRKKLANKLRQQSQHHQQQANAHIMDINEQVLKQWFAKYDCLSIIHGHTHRPAIHLYYNDEYYYTRYVLSDWHHQGNGLLITEDGRWRLLNFSSEQQLFIKDNEDGHYGSETTGQDL